MENDPIEAIRLLSKFTGPDLTQTLARIEGIVQDVSTENCAAFLESTGAGREVLAAAAEMKRLAGQINVTIHALGILLCLPHLLEPDEKVKYVSLGAGNTGRKFDLETNRRVAEFKFIRWRGGPESIRQNSIFKDYVLMAEHQTSKEKYLYVLGTHHVLKFLRGGRALTSVLSRNDKLQKLFNDRFGNNFRSVRDYYAAFESAVRIVDVSPWLSELAEDLLDEALPVEGQ